MEQSMNRYIGQMLDGRALMVIFKNALVTSGLEIEAKNKEQVTIPATVECYSDVEEGADLEKLRLLEEVNADPSITISVR